MFGFVLPGDLAPASETRSEYGTFQLTTSRIQAGWL